MYREFKVRFFVREDRSWPTWSGWVSSEVKRGVKGGGLTDIELIITIEMPHVCFDGNTADADCYLSQEKLAAIV